jgi:hypothetical protein
MEARFNQLVHFVERSVEGFDAKLTAIALELHGVTQRQAAMQADLKTLMAHLMQNTGNGTTPPAPPGT